MDQEDRAVQVVVAVPAATGLVNVLVGDAEDRVVPVALAAKDLEDLRAEAAVVVPKVARLAVDPAVPVVVAQKEGLLVEVDQALIPSEC